VVVSGVRAEITLVPFTDDVWYYNPTNLDEKADEKFGIELTVLKPEDPNVNITFELHDIVNDQLQPITTTKVFPALNFQFLIY
jgi:hypothetical protein